MVTGRIRIVDHGCASVWPGDSAYPLDATWNCSGRTTWAVFDPRQLQGSLDSLLIAMAVPATAKTRDFFLWLRDNPVPMPVFAILPEQDSEASLAAMSAVDDFLIWPARSDELQRRIARLIGAQAATPADVSISLATEMSLSQLVGQDPVFLRVRDRILHFGATNMPVLVTGETGTGKELCARVMHSLSPGRQGPFLPLDCGALPDHLFENEVFGHARGAFTDARADQKGLVALADHGTLFIDEIDSLSLSAQSKVLRLLQEHTYRPLGSSSYRHADVRVIAASNRDLEELVRSKQFRADLYFRINVLRVHLPPLRSRPTDVHLLSRHFIEEICRNAKLARKVLSPGAMRKLERHDWPGNLRELHNILQRAALCTAGTSIPASAVELPGSGDAESDAGVEPARFSDAKFAAIRNFERDYVHDMLERHKGNVTQAARAAGKERRAFGRLAKKYQTPRAEG